MERLVSQALQEWMGQLARLDPLGLLDPLARLEQMGRTEHSAHR
jgi:hypothetical protein